MAQRKFTEAEDAIVRAHYADGIEACMDHLSGRSRASVATRAFRMGLRMGRKGPRPGRAKRELWPMAAHDREALLAMRAANLPVFNRGPLVARLAA